MNNTELKNKLETLIDTAAKMKNAYFWSPPASATGRRSYEEYYSIPEFTFEFEGDTYTVEYYVRCSCNNIYTRGIYTKNGNKTTLTTIKNILNKIA